MSFGLYEIRLTDTQLVLGQATAEKGRGRQNNLGELHVDNLSQRGLESQVCNDGLRIKPV